MIHSKQIAVTPPRIQNARKISASREVTDVVLGLFSAKSIVTFEDIPVTKSARRILHIHNPTNDILKVRYLFFTPPIYIKWLHFEKFKQFNSEFRCKLQKQ